LKKQDAALPACDADGVVDGVKKAAASPVEIRVAVRISNVSNVKSYGVATSARHCVGTATTTAGIHTVQ
jgi:hypothetical protein